MDWWKSRKDSREDEIQIHIELETQENLDAGVEPKQARHAAMRKFGNVLSAREKSREIWGRLWLEQFWQDVSFSLRKLRKAPGFTTVAVLTLALGIGANTAIFTLLHAMLMKNLPAANPKTLVRIGDKNDCCVGQGNPDNGDYSLFPTAVWRLLKENSTEFEELSAIQAGFEYRPITARREREETEARSLMAEFVSGNYFRTFGLRPQAGRLLTDSDDAAGAPMTAVMSYHAWHSYYGGDAAVIGGEFRVNTKPVTVVGIAPAGFYGDRLSSAPPDFYLPIETMPALANAPYVHEPNTQWLYMVGRVKPDVYLPALQEKLSLLFRQYMAANRSFYSSKEGRALLPKVHVTLTPGGAGIRNMQEDYGANLRILMALSGLVLLIACANIANLLLARGMARKVEMSVRVALGAGRRRITRQLLTESVVLSVAGGVAGLAVAYAGARMLLALAFPGARNLPIQASPSPAVLMFGCGLSLLTGVLFGVAPAWVAARAEPADAMRSGASRTTAAGASMLQRGLVVLQAALSLTLLVVAGLFSRSLYKLQNMDMKLETTNRFIAHINPQAAGYSQRQVEALYRAIEERFHALPGVEKVGISTYTPMEDNNTSDEVRVEGKSDPNLSSSHIKINSEYFDSVGTRLVMGRGVSPQDTSASRPVAVVNQAFVKRLFNPGENPIGHTFGSPYSTSEYEIVGVVEDTVYSDARLKDRLMYFVPLPQRPLNTKEPIENDEMMYAGAITLKTTWPVRNMEALTRRTLASINPNLALVKFQTFNQQISEMFVQDRLIARLATLFGALALALATLGLYGLTAYTVARRTSEIGIRMALGAERSRVIAMVMRGALIQTALGLAIGVPTALLCVRFIEAQLYEVKGMDAGVLTASILTLILASGLAGLIPARRAVSIDPVQALRSE
ncbi:MAG: ABC transporter permease [Chloracidobacterium sp.]|nr:ABC transporter permease [Chloracidobacterium sp.]